MSLILHWNFMIALQKSICSLNSPVCIELQGIEAIEFFDRRCFSMHTLISLFEVRRGKTKLDNEQCVIFLECIFSPLVPLIRSSMCFFGQFRIPCCSEHMRIVNHAHTLRHITLHPSMFFISIKLHTRHRVA